MATVDIKELKGFLDWRIKHDAVKASDACRMIGIRRPTLTIWINNDKIRGRLWDGEWWFALKEVQKHVMPPSAGRVGRPRHGDTKQPVS